MKVKLVKNVCRCCGHAEELNWKEKLAHSLLNLFAGLGIIFVFYLLVVGFHIPINNIVNARFELLAKGEDTMMRELMLEMTDCDGSRSWCYAEQLYRNVSSIRYVPSSLYDDDAMYSPMTVYRNGGDCKNTANMYVSFLKSVGIQAHVDCSYEDAHCVAVVPRIYGMNYLNEKVVVDLTVPMAVQLYHHEDVWDYGRIAGYDDMRILWEG